MQIQASTGIQHEETSDGMLAQQALAGNQGAFEVLVHRYSEPLKPWLFQVARNRCLDDIRQRNRRRTTHFSELESSNDEEELPSLVSIPDSSPQPEELAERHDLQQRLHQAIQALPPKFRAVVFLRYAGQLSFSEIAEALNMPTATAKTYFQRAKPMLCANLRDFVGQSVAYY